MPFAQAQSVSQSDEFWLDVYYDGDIQTLADLTIENKMNGNTAVLSNVDLTNPVDLSQLDPTEGDFLKVVVTLDPNDPSKTRTICLIYAGGLLLRTVQMYSNQQTMGNLEVSNTGQNIDWDTQVLTANMKGPSPPSSAIVMTVSRSSQAVFIVNWDHTDNYIPACDNGFNYDVEFEFILENPNDSGRSQTVSRTVIDDKNGGFCTSPSPPEPAVTDPELQIVIQPPSTTISQEYFRSYGSVMLNVHEQNAYYDQNGQGIGWQVVDSRHDQAFGPSCTVYGSCYQLIIINWV
ncbi:MAG: hypothetical protein CMA22_00005 [Euryarchaeota archaeon]|jgi:hypothetical protein|nr:hypothetical protein [Euryarchaeota archaeon]|tara:strand:- start:7691 stop:8563 length:873 start_codon:yes stop_codon:yes gene_type:complete